MRHSRGYSRTQTALPWAVVLPVVVQYIFNDAILGAWDAIRQGRSHAFDPLILAQAAGGRLILALVVWRLVLRLRLGAPSPPENGPAALIILSHVVHWGFYALLRAMAATGLLAWFGGVGAAAQAHNVPKVALLALIGGCMCWQYPSTAAS